MDGSIPEATLRAKLVMNELYGGLPAERSARAYVLVSDGAEQTANALIDSWLKAAYRAGYERAQLDRARVEEARTQEFLEQARTVTRIVEIGTVREEEALKRGESESYPGGPVPVWCAPGCADSPSCQGAGLCPGDREQKG